MDPESVLAGTMFFIPTQDELELARKVNFLNWFFFLALIISFDFCKVSNPEAKVFKCRHEGCGRTFEGGADCIRHVFRCPKRKFRCGVNCFDVGRELDCRMSFSLPTDLPASSKVSTALREVALDHARTVCRSRAPNGSHCARCRSSVPMSEDSVTHAALHSMESGLMQVWDFINAISSDIVVNVRRLGAPCDLESLKKLESTYRLKLFGCSVALLLPCCLVALLSCCVAVLL